MRKHNEDFFALTSFRMSNPSIHPSIQVCTSSDVMFSLSARFLASTFDQKHQQQLQQQQIKLAITTKTKSVATAQKIQCFMAKKKAHTHAHCALPSEQASSSMTGQTDRRYLVSRNHYKISCLHLVSTISCQPQPQLFEYVLKSIAVVVVAIAAAGLA